MILCFSGTGNSRYIANRIAQALQEEVLDLNARIRSGDHSPLQAGENPVLVTPTYAWRIPRVVSEWLMQTELIGAKRIRFVMSCGSEIGNAAKYNARLALHKQIEYMGTAQIIMPENYIAMFNAPQAEEARAIVEKAKPEIAAAVECIRRGRAFDAPRNNLYDRFMSSIVNPVFYKFIAKSDAFRVGTACTGCGLCAGKCPMNNIRIRDKKPVWGSACTHCMACICYCPSKAIEYGKESIGKPRYHFEAL